MTMFAALSCYTVLLCVLRLINPAWCGYPLSTINYVLVFANSAQLFEPGVYFVSSVTAVAPSSYASSKLPMKKMIKSRTLEYVIFSLNTTSDMINK